MLMDLGTEQKFASVDEASKDVQATRRLASATNTRSKGDLVSWCIDVRGMDSYPVLRQYVGTVRLLLAGSHTALGNPYAEQAKEEVVEYEGELEA